jgi:hypothetical protein
LTDEATPLLTDLKVFLVFPKTKPIGLFHLQSFVFWQSIEFLGSRLHREHLRVLHSLLQTSVPQDP